MNDKEREIVPLAEIHADEKVRIVRLGGGHYLQSRLIGMGLVPGVEASITSNAFSGPVVLRLNASRVVLGRGVLDRIFVERCIDEKND